MNTNIEYCSQCPNHCPEDALRCGKGRNYFAQMRGEEQEDGMAEHGHRGHRKDEQAKGHGHESNHDHSHGHRDSCEHGLNHGHGHDCGHGPDHENSHGRNKGRGLSYEKDNLYSMMRACGHHLYIRSGRGAGQGRILAILLNRKRMTQKELQDILRIQPGSMSEILAKLEEKGFILRKKDEDDRRRSMLELTEAGIKEAAHQAEQGDGHPTFGALDEAEQEELKRLLGKLLDSWK